MLSHADPCSLRACIAADGGGGVYRCIVVCVHTYTMKRGGVYMCAFVQSMCTMRVSQRLVACACATIPLRRIRVVQLLCLHTAVQYTCAFVQSACCGHHHLGCHGLDPCSLCCAWVKHIEPVSLDLNRAPYVVHGLNTEPVSLAPCVCSVPGLHLP